MVETKHPPAKRRWKTVCRGRRGRPRTTYQSLNQRTSLASAAREKRQMQEEEEEDASFMTMCNNCKTIYEYHASVEGKQVSCRHCREVFVAEKTGLSTDLGGDDLSVISSSSQVGSISTPGSVSPMPPQEDELTSNDPRKAEKYGATKGSELMIVSSSKDMADQDFSQERSIMEQAPAVDGYFMQGIQLMVNGFFSLAKITTEEQLLLLMFYGRIVLRNFADLGVPDSGFGAHLHSLQQQAADIASRQSMASSSKASHDSLVDLMRATDRETLEARQKKAAIDEEVGDCCKQVERTEASLAEAKEREEMARRARIQAEEELTREKVKLKMAEASSEKATNDLEEKEEALAKAKEKVIRAEEELQVHVKALKESKAKWRTLCGQDPPCED